MVSNAASTIFLGCAVSQEQKSHVHQLFLEKERLQSSTTGSGPWARLLLSSLCLWGNQPHCGILGHPESPDPSWCLKPTIIYGAILSDSTWEPCTLDALGNWLSNLIRQAMCCHLKVACVFQLFTTILISVLRSRIEAMLYSFSQYPDNSHVSHGQPAF
jgi:hypothetical protein